MTASLCLHGALFQLSAYPENSGSISIDVRDRFNGAINSVTIFTGSQQAALEVYEALGPIFQRHGGSVRPLDVRPARPQEPAPAEEGWIEWGGGECPVDKHAIVRVRFRCGDEGRSRALDYCWQDYGGPGTIEAYRLVGEEG
jgi:hypothetical protein